MARKVKATPGGAAKKVKVKKGAGKAQASPKPAKVSKRELTLLERLTETSKHFDRLVNLIPAAYYFPKTPEEEIDIAAKYAQNKSNRAPKQGIKEASRKGKRERQDPSQEDSVVDMQAKRHKQKLEANPLDFGEDGPKGEDAGAQAASRPTAGAAEDAGHTETETTTASNTAKNASGPRHIMEDASQDQLKQRLAERIQQLRGSRKAPSNKKRLMTPAEKRKKARELAAKKSKGDALPVQGSKGENASSEGDSSAAASAPVFSKFDFSTAKRVGQGQEKKKGGSNNPMQLLAKVQADKEKLDRLKAEDPEKAKAKQEKEQWKAAMLRAEGVKIKDDPKLLKKAIKRKETQKAKTKKDWGERLEIVDKFKVDKQKKRRTQLKDRAQAKVDKKINRGKKPKTTKKKPGDSKPKKKNPGFQ